MQVDITSSASKQIRKLTKQARAKVSDEIKRLESLSNTTEIPPDKLKGYSDRCKIRIGNYRAVYKKITSTHIQVTAIRDRKDIYNKLFGLTFSL